MLYTIFGVLSVGLIGLDLFLKKEWLNNKVSLAMTEVILKCINLIFEICIIVHFSNMLYKFYQMKIDKWKDNESATSSQA